MSPRRESPPAPTWVSISSSASPAAPSPRWRPRPRNTTGIAIPKCRSIIRSRPRCRIVGDQPREERAMQADRGGVHGPVRSWLMHVIEDDPVDAVDVDRPGAAPGSWRIRQLMAEEGDEIAGVESGLEQALQPDLGGEDGDGLARRVAQVDQGVTAGEAGDGVPLDQRHVAEELDGRARRRKGSGLDPAIGRDRRGCGGAHKNLPFLAGCYWILAKPGTPPASGEPGNPPG